MRTITASTACLLACLSAGTARAQTSAPQQTPPPRPSPQNAVVALPGQPEIDGAANAANLWVNQVIGKILEGPPEDRGEPARPSR